MSSARPAPRGGARILFRCLCLCLTAGCTAPNPDYSPRFDGSADKGGGDLNAGSGGRPWATGGAPQGAGGTPFGTGGVPQGTGGAGGTPVATGGTPLATGGAPSGVGGVSPGDGGAGGAGNDAFDPPMDVASDNPDSSADVGPAQVGPSSDSCGTAPANLSAITGARGIAIAGDGTVFYTRESGGQAWIGRIDPSGTNLPSWLPLPTNAQPRVLRVDAARNVVFVAGTGSGYLYVSATKEARVGNSSAGLTGVHGLAVAKDGAVFASLASGHIMRVILDLTSSRRQVSSMAVMPAGQRPLGLAFGPNDELFVGSSDGHIRRFVYRDQMLQDGVDYGTFTGAANDLAFDVHGRLYVADSVGTTLRSVSIIPPTGVGAIATLGTPGLPTALAFGRGTLDCQALYVGDAQGPVRRLTAPALGLATP